MGRANLLRTGFWVGPNWAGLRNLLLSPARYRPGFQKVEFNLQIYGPSEVR
jgi:hypothetical protein